MFAFDVAYLNQLQKCFLHTSVCSCEAEDGLDAEVIITSRYLLNQYNCFWHLDIVFLKNISVCHEFVNFQFDALKFVSDFC